MNLPVIFPPSRRIGLPFQLVLSLVLLVAGGYLLYRAIQAPAGTDFVLNLVVSLLLLAPVPVLIYRAYCLLGGRYTLERDGLRLRWGLRAEDIPLPEIEWLRPLADLEGLYTPGKSKRGGLPLPWVRWPGALVGISQVEGLGKVEFLASDASRLVLVATRQRMFAVSPADPGAFIQAYNRIMELGSLAPLRAASVYPSFMMSRLWNDRVARGLLLAGLVLTLALLVWVLAVIPSRSMVALGFTPDLQPGEAGPAERLLLLPVLAGLTLVTSSGLGLYFYRRNAQRLIAYLLWGGSAFEATLLLAAVYFITS